jgi:hypothetical protein
MRAPAQRPILATRFTEATRPVSPAPEGARRVPRPGGIDGKGRALAVAGVSPGPGSLGRRALVRARDARVARRAGDGHAQRAPDRGDIPRVPTYPRGKLRRRFVADRGGRRDHAGDRHGTAEVRVADAGGVARRRGRRPGAVRGGEARGDGEGRGNGAGRPGVGHGTAVQRMRPLRRGARGRPARLPTRRCRALRVGPSWS